MKKSIVISASILSAIAGFSQNNVGIGTASPHASALVQMSSTTKGLLIPSMTSTERDAIANPANGLLIYDNNASGFYYFNNTWKGIRDIPFNSISFPMLMNGSVISEKIAFPIYGQATGNIPVISLANISTTGTAIAVQGITNSSDAAAVGIYGLINTSTGNGTGIKGEVYNANVVSNSSVGVYGKALGGIGLKGESNSGYGLYASSNTGSAIYATSENYVAGYFLKGNGASTSSAVYVNSAANNYAVDIVSAHPSPKALKTSGALQFTNIGEQEGAVLTTDDQGNATWKKGGMTATAFGEINSDGTIVKGSGNFLVGYNSNNGEYTITVGGLQSTGLNIPVITPRTGTLCFYSPTVHITNANTFKVVFKTSTNTTQAFAFFFVVF